MEPDLVPFEPGAEWVDRVKKSLGETPAKRRERFASEFGLGTKDIEVLTSSIKVADYFEAAAKAYGGEAKKVANWILADLFGLANEAGIEVHESKVAPEQVAGLVKLIDDGRISGKQGKQVLQEMFETGKDADAIAERARSRTGLRHRTARSVRRRGDRGEPRRRREDHAAARWARSGSSWARS